MQPLPDPKLPRWVPVVSSTGLPLMPCHPARARKLLAKGAAIKRYRRGLFYLQLTQRATGDTQPIALGVDPGSKREGYTVKAASRTFLNVHSHAINGKAIQKAVEARANARHARRQRNTPCRANKQNRARAKGWVPPSTKARWQLKLNVIRWLSRLYPITTVVIEDVQTELKKGEKRRNADFSPVQNGKNWLYSRVRADGYILVTKRGMETYQLRQSLGLQKTKNKLALSFDAHCVDSWVLANEQVGGHTTPDLVGLVELKPLVYARRQLHRFNPGKGGVRSRYGGTRSLGYQRGTLVIHPKHGKCLVGGHNGKGHLSLHSHLTATRLTQHANPTDLIKISHSPWIVIDPTTGLKDHKRALRLQKKQAMSHLTHLTSSPPRADSNTVRTSEAKPRGIRGGNFR